MSDSQARVLDYASPRPASNGRLRAVIAGLLLIFGAQLWLVLGKGYYGNPWQYRLLLLALIVSVIPPLAALIARPIDRMRAISTRTIAILAAAITLLSADYFVFTAWYQQRPFVLEYLDEFSYSIGMHQAANLRLWMPQHPAGDFFEALELIVHPVYASMYFPGTAILYAPSVWLHLPFWMMPALAAGACVGLTFRIVAELLDPVAGILCALMLIGTGIFRLVSIMLLSQTPVLLMCLLALWAWLHWRRNHRIGWAIAMGFFAGFAAITRPMDAAALLVPVAIAVILERKHIKTAVLSAMCGVAPFAILQVIFNLAVTGSPLTTPFQFSHAQDYPQTSLGFHTFDPAAKPASSLPQKQRHYENVTVPAVREHRLETLVSSWRDKWLPRLLRDGLPNVFLIALLPVGWLTWTQGRWVLGAAVIPWALLYALWVFKLPHYSATIAPALTIGVVCGIESLRQSWPRARSGVTVFFTAAVVILSLTETAELNRVVRDEWYDPSALIAADKLVRDLPEKPAVILFKYDPTITSEIEPVYNAAVAYPDDAPVIRAHDLGDRNIEIFRYYAAKQPSRVFYRFDRKTEKLERLGTASQLGSSP